MYSSSSCCLPISNLLPSLLFVVDKQFILGYTLISFSFQSLKHVIKAKDPQLV